MTMFDKLCKTLEGDGSDYRDRVLLEQHVRKAALFEIPDDSPGGTLDIAPIIEDFFLPFPSIAINTGHYAVLIVDDPEIEGVVRGLDVSRLIAFTFRDPKDELDGITGMATVRVQKDLPEDLHRYEIGPKGGEGPTTCHCIVDNTFGYREKDAKEVPPKIMSDLSSQMFMQVIGHLSMINAPSKFVVEKTPKRVRDPNKSKKIPRSHERPTFTVLDRREVDELFVIPRSAVVPGGKRRAHRRRAHWRTFRSERYTKARGKRKLIAAQWIGPEEVRVRGKHYRVRLDIAGYESSRPKGAERSPETQ